LATPAPGDHPDLQPNPAGRKSVMKFDKNRCSQLKSSTPIPSKSRNIRLSVLSVSHFDNDDNVSEISVYKVDPEKKKIRVVKDAQQHAQALLDNMQRQASRTSSCARHLSRRQHDTKVVNKPPMPLGKKLEQISRNSPPTKTTNCSTPDSGPVTAAKTRQTSMTPDLGTRKRCEASKHEEDKAAAAMNILLRLKGRLIQEVYKRFNRIKKLPYKVILLKEGVMKMTHSRVEKAFLNSICNSMGVALKKHRESEKLKKPKPTQVLSRNIAHPLSRSFNNMCIQVRFQPKGSSLPIVLKKKSDKKKTISNMIKSIVRKPTIKLPQLPASTVKHAKMRSIF